MGEFVSYLYALFTNWFFLMSTGPFLADRLVSWFLPAARVWLDENAGRRRQRIGLSLVILGVFAGGFLTWRDEYRKNPTAMPRNLTATESLCITESLTPLREDYKYFSIISTPDDDSSLYAADFHEAF